MPSHISLAAASSWPRALRRALLALALLAVPLAAHALYGTPAEHATAQVYVWRDTAGAVHFSPAAANAAVALAPAN